MSETAIEIETRDGVAPCRLFSPPGGGKRPAVILYQDAFGVRPALRGMAERLASNGYHALLPDLYYRWAPVPPFDPASAFQEGPERERLMSLVRSLKNSLVISDTAGFLDYLERQPAVAPIRFGCVGYCMGGPFALSAAGRFPERIAVAASIHGGRLATDQPDSPHLLAPRMRGVVYVGIAGLDTHFTAEEKQRLESALQSAGVRHAMEVYPGVKHGFAVNDSPVYDRAAAELHWDRILKLFAENLSPHS